MKGSAPERNVEQHPADHTLIAFAHGTLNSEQQVAVEEHLLHCDTCCKLLDESDHDTVGSDRMLDLAREAVRTAEMDEGSWFDPASCVQECLESEAESSLRVSKLLEDHPRYHILGEVGSGGMGAVYKAEHRLMNRLVAIKAVKGRLLLKPSASKRFRREVLAAAKLSHPGIVVAYDAEEYRGVHFLVMEYVEGTDLASLIQRDGPLPLDEACDIIRQAADGLQHAFEQGMVHRDIKPHNLMMTADGRIKILDFGLARFVSEQSIADGYEHGPVDGSKLPSPLTCADTLVGTRGYAAPEQMRDACSADIRADLYGLGAVLYFLLKGRPPELVTGIAESETEDAASIESACENSVAQSTDDTVRTSVKNRDQERADRWKDLPSDIVPILDRMLAENPNDRYQTPADVVPPLTSLIRPAETKRIHRLSWVIATLTSVVIFALGYEWLARRPTEQPTPEIAAPAIDELTGALRNLKRALADHPDDEAAAAGLAQLLLLSREDWRVLEPTEMKSAGGATLSLKEDGSILASGQNPDGDIYTIITKTDVRRVSAIRIEALTHDSLPNRGPGRLKNPAGNFSMKEFEVTIRQSDTSSTPLPLAEVISDENAYALTVHRWNNRFQESKPNTAVYYTDEALDLVDGAQLAFRMEFEANKNWPGTNLGCFRISVTDDPTVFSREQRRMAASRIANPWHKLATAYYLNDDESSLDNLVQQHPHAALGIVDLEVASQDWGGAIERLSQLIEEFPDDTQFVTRRADVYFATEQWDLAKDDWLRAIDKHPSQSIDDGRRRHRLLQDVFNRFKESGRYREAAAFWKPLLEQEPNDSYAWLSAAPILALAGDEAAYAEFCRWIMEQRTETVEQAERAIKACLLRPEAIDIANLHLDTLTEALDSGNESRGLRSWGWNTRALLAYRSGDAESAIQYAARSEALQPVDLLHAINLAVRALAEHQLEHPDDARQTLEEASQLINQLKADKTKILHHDLQIAQILLAEAEAKFTGRAKPQGGNAKPSLIDPGK